MSLAFLEYEEQFGRLWDRLVGGRASLPRFPEAAVALEAERRRLAVLFRGLGGDPGLELVASSETASNHRLRVLQRLGMGEERLARAERTSQLVLLPPVLDCLPSASLNRDLYVWLVAYLAGAECPAAEPDPLRRDLLRLRHAARRTAAVLHDFPGLRSRHAALASALLALRPVRRLPPVESGIEAVVRQLHGGEPATGPLAALVAAPAADPGVLAAPRRYRPFLPSPLWGEVRDEAEAEAAARQEAERGSGEASDADRRHRRARRRRLDNTERSDPSPMPSSQPRKRCTRA